MDSTAEWEEIVDAAANRPQELAELIYRKYGARVLAIINKYLGNKLKQRVDAEDIADDMWASLLRIQEELILKDKDSFRSMLLTMATRKVFRAARTNKDLAFQEEMDSHAEAIDRINLSQAIKRNYAKQPEPESTPDSFFESGFFEDSFFEDGELKLMCYGCFRDADRHSHFDASAASTAAEMIKSLPADAQEIALRRLEGYSNAEIAEQRGTAVRTVDRWVTEIKAAWAEYMNGDEKVGENRSNPKKGSV